MKESVTTIWCPICGEVSEYHPEMIRIIRGGYNAEWTCPECGHRENFNDITLQNSATFLRENKPLIEFEKYEHHGVMMWTMKDLKGKHNKYCLCTFCEHWRPNTSQNCPIAEALFQFVKEHQLVAPVWECAQFKEKNATY